MYAFVGGHSNQHRVDRAVNELKDVSLKAELHRYRAYKREAERMEQRLHALSQALGGVQGESQRLLRNQASEGSNESHASLDHSMRTNTTNEVGVVAQNTNVQHIGDPTPPQGDLKGKGKRTFASLDDSPGIPAAVQPTPTPATKKVRNVAHGRPMQLHLTSESEVVRQPPSAGVAGATRKAPPLSRRVPQPSSSSYCAPYVFGPEPALRPTHWDQDPYPTTEEDSSDDDDLAALAQGDPSKLQKVMASEVRPQWLLNF
ncbi:hypothetical protein EDB84DRAFT_1567582 [Lactarius hengduanensis]|nr:hypothetical protein EDB84DRAFT_1567582 [Lactarius hengduanensis]